MIAAGISESTSNELGHVLAELHADLIKAMDVLDLQERIASSWCMGDSHNTQQGNGNNVGFRATDTLRMDQIRATVNHVIEKGFMQCQESFTLHWMNALTAEQQLSDEEKDKFKNELRLCIKDTKSGALNTLDTLKYECFLKSFDQLDESINY